jgi:hypothetical protein
MSSLFLTDPFTRSLRPGERGRVEYWDDNVSGLSIRVSEAGRKTWSVMYRVNGRLRRYTLGVYPVLGLADARRKAAAALRDASSGTDPAAEKIAARPRS